MFRSRFVTLAEVVALIALSGSAGELSIPSNATSLQWSAAGDRMFREARFDEAETAYTRAVDLDARNVQGQLGMGRMATVLSNPRAAADHYSAAYQVAPLNPDVILAY